IEQGLKSVDGMRADVERRFPQGLAESKKAENGGLAEANLRNKLERERGLFYSGGGQVNQAPLVRRFGSGAGPGLRSPVAAENRPPMPLVLLAALVAGCGLGAGAVYVADQLDARIRSLSEIRRLLEYRMLGVVHLLGRTQQGEVPIGLISHVKPRSRIA